VALDCLSHGNLFLEAFHGVFALKLLELDRGVLVQELVDAQVAAADSDVDLLLVNLDADTFAAEVVNTLGFTHKHNLQLLAVRVVVDVLSNLFVDLVIFDGDVNRDSRLQVDDVVAENLNFLLHVIAVTLGSSQVLEQVQLVDLRLVELVLKVSDVLSGTVQVILQSLFLLLHLLAVLHNHQVLILDVLHSLHFVFKVVDLSILLAIDNSQRFDCLLKLVDLQLVLVALLLELSLQGDDLGMLFSQH